MAEARRPAGLARRLQEFLRGRSAVPVELPKNGKKLTSKMRAELTAEERLRRSEEWKDLSVGRVGDAGTQVVELDYPRHKIQLLATSRMEVQWRAHSCAKEPWTVQWLEESVKPGTVLYDIGANVGAFSLIAAKLCRDAGRVVAFEPGYASYARLCDNLVLNKCESVIVPLPLALGRSTGISTFTYRTLHPGQSRHVFQEGMWKGRSGGKGDHYAQPVLTMSLDEVVRAFGLRPPDHIKIDVDGAEMNVLAGAADLLSRAELKSILIEIDTTLTVPVSALLRAKGFDLDQRSERNQDQETAVWYGVFRRVT